MDSKKHATDPQQDEIDGNILGKPFEALAGDTKGRQPATNDGPSASQTAGVEDTEKEDDRKDQ